MCERQYTLITDKNSVVVGGYPRTLFGKRADIISVHSLSQALCRANEMERFIAH